jgi:hypothetical protein
VTCNHCVHSESQKSTDDEKRYHHAATGIYFCNMTGVKRVILINAQERKEMVKSRDLEIKRDHERF